MSNCLIQNGITVSCDDRRRVGGAKTRFWVGQIGNLATPIDTESATYISSLDFNTYEGLYEFEGMKKSHQFGYTMVTAAGGQKSYNHDFIAKLISTTPTDDGVIQDLAVADDAFIVAQDNNGDFYILGGSNGMEMTAGVRNTGVDSSADISDVLTFVGEERTIPKRFFDTDAATTLALIESYVV